MDADFIIAFTNFVSNAFKVDCCHDNRLLQEDQMGRGGVVEGGEAAEVFGGLAFFGEADAAWPERGRRVAFGEGFDFDGDVVGRNGTLFGWILFWTLMAQIVMIFADLFLIFLFFISGCLCVSAFYHTTSAKMRSMRRK